MKLDVMKIITPELIYLFYLHFKIHNHPLSPPPLRENDTARPVHALLPASGPGGRPFTEDEPQGKGHSRAHTDWKGLPHRPGAVHQGGGPAPQKPAGRWFSPKSGVWFRPRLPPPRLQQQNWTRNLSGSRHLIWLYSIWILKCRSRSTFINPNLNNNTNLNIWLTDNSNFTHSRSNMHVWWIFSCLKDEMWLSHIRCLTACVISGDFDCFVWLQSNRYCNEQWFCLYDNKSKKYSLFVKDNNIKTIITHLAWRHLTVTLIATFTLTWTVRWWM